MTRAAVVIVRAGSVALIERRRPRDVYYLFPGGTVEEGETPAEAARREAREELGLDVQVGRLIAEVSYRGNVQFHFVGEVLGGVFGTGDGLELHSQAGAEGTYRPVWLPLQGLSSQPVHPRAVALLVEHSATGWPREVLRVEDAGRQREAFALEDPVRMRRSA